MALPQEAVSIKGTKNGLVIVFNPELDIEEIKSILRSKMENSGGFFRGAKFVVYDYGSGKNQRYVDELEGLCRNYGLIPSTEVSWPPAGISGESRPDPPPARRKKAEIIPIRQHSGEEEPALLVARTLRSGQAISSRCSVVVMGDVNPGAEVVSEGSIFVLGACKGSVHAGAAGNLLAEVTAFRLQPLVLRIGTIQAATPAPPDLEGPAKAMVSRGKILFAKW